MNGVREDKYSLRFTQTSKGVFYIDKIELYSDDMATILKEMKKYAGATVMLLEDLNLGKIDRGMVNEK